MSDRDFKVVTGFVRGVDRLPRRARDLGFTRRCAFVLESYRAGDPEPWFDAELYAVLMRAARASVAADVAIAELPSGERFDATETSALLAGLDRAPEREPFPAITFTRGAETVALATFEPFVQIGGPDPYHDSYTVPVYTRDDVSRVLAAAALKEAEALGARCELVRADDAPGREGLGRALASMLRRIFIGPWSRARKT